MMVAHKSREEIDGKEGFQQQMSVPPYKNVLKSQYEGMQPISIRRFD